MSNTYQNGRHTVRLSVAMSMTLLFGAAGNLYAQADTESGRTVKQIEEIVVTARKREETLQEAPVAISVLSGDMLEQAGVESMNGVGSRLPNVSSIDQPPGVNGNEFAPTIRGMETQYRQIGAESSLGLFVDGAYAGNNANGNRFLPPVERVEFLPGPQATLFGKNTTIGVINVVTKKPGDELEVLAHADVGNNGHLDYGGSIFGPLSDNWGIGLTLGKREYSGYVRNENPPLSDPLPEDCWEIDFATFEFNFDAPMPCFGYYWAGLRDGEVGPEMDSWGADLQLAYRGETTTFDLLVEYNDTERWNVISAQRVEGFDALPRDVISTSIDNTATNDERAATATFVKDFANGGELTSITGYRKFHTDQDIDDDSYYYRVVEIFNWVTDQEQKSQELRYSGEAGNVSYLLGAYWQDQELYMYRSGDVWEITPNLHVEGIMKNKTLAFFANADFDLGDRWGAELGVRRGSETKDMPRYYNDTSEAGYWVGTISDSLDSDKTSFTAALTFAPVDNLNTHLRYSRGFKSGGFGIEFITVDFQPPEEFWKFKEEKADSWELGLKWQATDALWLNTALFLTDYKDLQVNQLYNIPGSAAPFFSIGNADEARTRGIEVTAIYQGENLDLNASIGYNDAYFVKWQRPADLDENGEFTFEDMAGRELASPRNTANLMANYHFDVGGRELSLIGEYQYRGDSVADPGADPLLHFSDAVNQVNARIRYEISDNLSVTLWGRNLFDERAITGRGSNLQEGFIADGWGWYVPPSVAEGIGGQVTGSIQAPLHYGLTLNYQY